MSERSMLYLAMVASTAFISIAFWLFSSSPEQPAHFDKLPTVILPSSEPILPIPQTLHLDARKVALGRRLFHETQLSSNNKLACATCHQLARAGVDGMARSRGLNGVLEMRNTPTVFNADFNASFFWDGGASSLEEQLDGPVHNATEFATDWNAIVERLNKIPSYRKTFVRIYPNQGINEHTLKDALAVFERSLITPDSRFDQYLRGDKNAISPQEKSGYLLFKKLGCVSCHQGINVGGNLFQKLGVMEDYYQNGQGRSDLDPGRYGITGKEEDLHVFKVPSLRNVALTAPYFHDGSVPDLPAAVARMGKYQLGKNLSGEEIASIVLFLKTLTGKYNGVPL